MKTIWKLAVASALMVPTAAVAQVTACVTVSASGPAASLGISEQNTVPFVPKKAGEAEIRYIVYDDASDPTNAARNARKCVEDHKADIIIGSSTSPAAAAAASVAAESGTPIIAVAPVNVPPNVDKWTFRTAQRNEIMATAIFEHMKKNKVKTLGFIGYNDAFGEDWLIAIQNLLKDSDIKIGPIERFARTDTSVTGQALKLVSAKPDAVLIIGTGTSAALPATTLKERGFKGLVYHSQGAGTRDFIRVGGKNVDANLVPLGPVVVANQLPDAHPSKKLGIEYTREYEAAHGAGSVSAFGGMLFDAGQLVVAAVPKALEKGKPGTPEFRAALRDNIEGLRDVVGVNGVYNITPADHFGHDSRSRVLVQVDNGDFKFVSMD